MGYGGCLRKVDSERLSALLLEAGFAGYERRSFLDAEVRALPAGAGMIATTTDLIYDFGSSPRDFGYIAVAHALSDLYAVLARPLVTTIALGIPPGALDSGAAAEILRGYQQALIHEGVEMGGGHTVFANDPFVGITAVGIDAVAAVPSWPRGSQWVLLLSKPLGSGVYLTARAHGMLAEPSADSVLMALMRETNGSAASDLRELFAVHGRDALACVTDVTGFGLLLALESQLRDGCQAELRSTAVPVLESVAAVIENHGLATVLGEHSMISIDDDSGVTWSHISRTVRLVLSDPQTSGGLLAAVSRSAADSLLSSSSVGWAEIGTVSVSADASAPHITVS